MPLSMLYLHINETKRNDMETLHLERAYPASGRTKNKINSIIFTTKFTTINHFPDEHFWMGTGKLLEYCYDRAGDF